MAGTKANITYEERQVYLSSYPGKAGARVLEPIARRLSNYLDVAHHGHDVCADTNALVQVVEDASDFVLLLDDHVCAALRESDVNKIDTLTLEQLQGRELLVVLRRNELQASQGQPQTRLWLAKAETIKLLALRKVGGRSDWSFVDFGAKGLLHWLYPEGEKVLEHQARPDDDLFVGDDETRLGQQVDAFYDHPFPACPACKMLGCTGHAADAAAQEQA
jgi:hypothetical protein